MFSGHGAVLDTEASKNVAVVHKTNQGYSGKDLYRLKAERPELFTAQPSSDPRATQIPQGFKAVANVAGYYYNQERNVYWEKASDRFLCRDATTNEYYDLVRGNNLSSMLAVRGDAAACAGRNGGAGSKHVAIGDLHKAAAALKLDMSHHDSPAAMFAIYDSGVAGSAVAEAAAKGFHVRLLPRLAGYRGLWTDARLQAAVSESIEALSAEINAEAGIAMAFALLIGRRLVLASSRGGLCMLFGASAVDEINVGEESSDVDVRSETSVPSMRCIEVDDIHLGVLLTVDAMYKAGMSPNRLRSLVRMHVVADRPRAACIGTIAEARRGGCEAPLAASAIRFAWTQEDDGSAQKRAKTAGLPKVRCRHILLRHSGSQNPGDRKPKATRSVHEAEAEMLNLLQELQFGGAAAFTDKCRAVSECDSKLKGGDLSGDLGWLDKDPTKNKKIPAIVVRTALTLSTGQFSDVISSERGVHLLLRTA